MRPSIVLPALALAAALKALPAADVTVLTGDGADAVTLDLPSDWKVWPDPGIARIEVPDHAPHLELHRLRDVTDPAAVVDRVPALIVGAVTGFMVGHKESLIIAGRPAIRLIGTGTEADDGDPANAEVVLFSVAGKTLMLVAHGEGEGAAKRRSDLATMLTTAK